MKYHSTEAYLDLLDELYVTPGIADNTVSSLMGYVKSIYRSDLQNSYSEPMLWIGMYIALASLFCILAMVADLLHGLRRRKLWFPCKYFRVNAFYLSVISVAMKLPVDLSGSMPGDVDQAAKLGSMAFMCTMMANLLPCLATMNSTELLTNITALGIFVITLVVNVCIQIKTGVVSFKEEGHVGQAVATNLDLKSLGINKDRNIRLATTYVTLLMALLMIYICSSLAILKSKQIIEAKYRQQHETALKDVQQPTEKFLTFGKLELHVRKYWIMAGSGSPQFIIACSATTTASGVICAITTILHTLTMSWTISAMLQKDYDSDYKWSTLVILIVQFVGVILGTIAPLCRCFAALSFKLSIKSIPNHIKVFKVEAYWTQMLYYWKDGSIRFPFRKRKPNLIIKTLKALILKFCIDFQEGVVVVCKMIALIPFFFMICVLYCLRCLKWLLQVVLKSPGENTMELSQYVLQLESEKELAERTLKGLSKSMDRLIQNGVQKQPKNLMKLLEKSSEGFQGVKKFDNGHYVPFLSPKVEYQDCWSLPVVTLTTIAVALLENNKDNIDSLLESVREGLEYVSLVEETLNATEDYVRIQKAADALWQEVYISRKWLGDKLERIASQVRNEAKEADVQVDTKRQIVKLFLEKAKTKINEGVESTHIGCPDDDTKCRSICALSMSRITKTIIDEKVTQNELLEVLSSWIADIMVACLTNLPQAIAVKCHTSEIEKRVASVEAAAQLLGECKEIIKTIQHPRQDKGSTYLKMNPDDLPFLDKWRAYLCDP